MLNRVILIGRLTRDVELRYTNTGTPVATFNLAVDRNRQGQDGRRETDFIDIVVWQKQAEICAQYLQKGRLAAVDGRLQIRAYENREGQKVRVAEVVAESIRFLDRGEPASAPSTSSSSRPPSMSSREQTNGRGRNNNSNSNSRGRYEDDPFADDSQIIDISEDDLPF